MSCKLMTAMGTKKQNVPADNFITVDKNRVR